MDAQQKMYDELTEGMRGDTSGEEKRLEKMLRDMPAGNPAQSGGGYSAGDGFADMPEQKQAEVMAERTMERSAEHIAYGDMDTDGSVKGPDETPVRSQGRQRPEAHQETAERYMDSAEVYRYPAGYRDGGDHHEDAVHGGAVESDTMAGPGNAGAGKTLPEKRKPRPRKKAIGRMSFDELRVEREHIEEEYKARLDRIDALMEDKREALKSSYMEGLIHNYIATHGGSDKVTYEEALRAVVSGGAA